jgi:hypothetical protein
MRGIPDIPQADAAVGVGRQELAIWAEGKPVVMLPPADPLWSSADIQSMDDR